jgi:Na+/proline symporter
MVWTIDHGIFILFLILNIIFGLKSSKGIKNIREYAIGDGSFNTSTIVATTVATWMCGETFFSTITETYQHGLYFLLPCILAFVMNFFIIGYFIAPRMTKFIGKLSIAEAMGDLYGPRVRLITTISGFIGVSGFIAVQLKITGIIVNYAFGLPETYGIVISGLIITLYSSLGGIKSVTFTDVIQFFTFGTILPIVTVQIFYSLDSIEPIFHTIKTNPNFSLSKVLDFSEPKTWYYASIFFFCFFPALNPAEFQRVSMAKNWKQVRKVFYITGILIFFIMSSIAWLSLIILSKDPNIPVENLVKDHIFSTAITGYKGLLLVGITAMIMSTADSYINCSSVLFTHDFFKALNIKLSNELLSARFISFFIGISGIVLAFKESSLFHLAIFTASFFIPIVSVPFLMAILGYKTPYEKAVLYGMAAGFMVVLLWNYLDITVIDSIAPAVFTNWIVLVIMHKYYCSKERKISFSESLN